MKRIPPLPFATSLVLTSILVWAVPRAILTAGARSMAGRYGISPELSPLTLLLLAIGVSWVVLLDTSRTRERVLLQDLGVAPSTILGMGFCTALACEGILAAAPILMSALGGG